MRASYDASADAFLFELEEGTPVTRTTQWGPGVTVDLDDRGRVLAIEVTQASAHFDAGSLAQLRPPVVRLSLAQASKESGLSTETLRNQLNKGRLKGEKQGRDWTTTRAELISYLESRSPAGRPAFKYKARRSRPMILTDDGAPVRKASPQKKAKAR